MDKKILIAGVDEAGRGPLAGPVIAAAVILPENHGILGLADSKKLTAARREALNDLIHKNAFAVSVGRAEVEEIDQLNILWATMLAMQRAIHGLNISPELVLVDGNRCPDISYPARAIIGGDESEPIISAASIVAKVARDREMYLLHQTFPEYDFMANKGYATKKHLIALKQHGPCEVHRKTFEPVASVLT